VVCVVILGLGQGAALSLALLMIVLRAGDDHTAARLSSMAQGFGYLLAAAGPLGMGLPHPPTRRAGGARSGSGWPRRAGASSTRARAARGRAPRRAPGATARRARGSRARIRA